MDSLLRSDLVLLVVDAEKGFTKQEKSIAKEVIKKGKRMESSYCRHYCKKRL